MFASMMASTIHVLPLTRPMPSAKELSTDSTTAATATVREMMRLLRNFIENFVVVQKETMPSMVSLRQTQWAGCVIADLRLEGVDGQHEQREQDDQCGDDQQDQRHPVACRADVLRLVRCPLRRCGGHCLCHGSILDFGKMRFGVFWGVWSGVVSLESDHVLFDALLDDGEHHGEDDDDHGQGGGDGGAVADLLHLEELVVRVVRRHCGRGARPTLGQ